MAWVATDNFENYPVGDLNLMQAGGTGWAIDNNSWSGDAKYDVGNTVYREGTKAMYTTYAGALEYGIGRNLLATTTDGSVHVSMMRSVTNVDHLDFWICQGGNTVSNRVFGVQFLSDGTIAAVGLTSTSLGAHEANVWYDIDMEYDCSTDKFRVSVNGCPWTSWLDFRTTETNLDAVNMYNNNTSSSTASMYWDDIRPSVTSPIAFDSAYDAGYVGSAASTKTWSHTCSGENRILFVNVHAGTNAVTGVTYNGVAMTKINEQATDYYSYMYALVAPATGTHDVVVTASSPQDMLAHSISYTGVSQHGVPNIVANSTASGGANITGSVTTLAPNSWLMMYLRFSAAGTMVPLAGTNERLEDATYGFYTYDRGACPVPGTNTLVVSDASTGTKYAMTVAIEPAITSNSISESTQLRTNLASYWRLEEASGTRYDGVGTNDLSVNGTGGVGSTTGVRGTGATFVSANTQYLSKSSPVGLPTGSGAATVSFWIKSTQTGTVVPIEWGTAGSGTRSQYYYDTTANRLYFSDNTNSTYWTMSGSTISNGSWHHIVVTRGSGAMSTTNEKAYLDGVELTKASSGTSTPNVGTNALSIGRSTLEASYYVNGDMDEIAIYTRKLGASEVSALYNGGASLFFGKLVDVLVVAGGGGGGRGDTSNVGRGGGGGGGGLIYDTNHGVGYASYAVTVGAGGRAGNTAVTYAGAPGYPSIFDNLIAWGGGGGMGGNSGSSGSNCDGGSSGGGASAGGLDAGTAMPSGQGNTGGTGVNGQSAGGGGGAGSAGGNGSGTTGGAGGSGYACSITGASVTYAGGGGGCGYGTGGAAGSGGGGAGSNTTNATAGTDGLGGGGGGAMNGNLGGIGSTGADGGDGVVIIRYLTSDFGTVTGGSASTDGSYTVRSFSSSGTISFGEPVATFIPRTAFFM